MTTKLKLAWEWLLHVNSQLLMFFHLFVWMPAVVFLWWPWVEEPASSTGKTLLVNVVMTYLLFLPLLFELVRDHIKAKRIKL